MFILWLSQAKIVALALELFEHHAPIFLSFQEPQPLVAIFSCCFSSRLAPVLFNLFLLHSMPLV